MKKSPVKKPKIWNKLFLILTLSIPLMLTACLYSDHLAPVVSHSRHLGPRPTTYSVDAGDTLYSVAFSFDMDFQTLAAMNQLQPPYALFVGQVLQLKLARKSSVLSTLVEKLPVKAAILRGHWRWPTVGSVIQSFGPQNKGIDIGGHFGQAIYASTPGVVVYAGHGIQGYGKMLIIKYGENYLIAYAYNAELLVKEGDRIHQGQWIANMGLNNNHRAALHYEVRFRGKPVNPKRFF